MEEDRQFTAREEKVAVFLKEKKHWSIALVALALAYFAYWLRTRNLAGLRDVSTGSWTLGPDLDPFLFLRWAKYIVEHGSLMPIDTFRYVPSVYYTSGELPGLPYMIAWFHMIASTLWTTSVEHSAVIFPAFMFALTVLAFFALVRLVFIEHLGERRANIVATIASFFLIIIPTLLPRTIAGIPEKESAGFLLLFLAFYTFIKAWRSTKPISAYIWATLAGLVAAAMNLTWGGAAYILFTISVASFIAFLLGQMNRTRSGALALWLVVSIACTFPFTTRFGANFFDSLQNYGLAIPQLITMLTLLSVGIQFMLVRVEPLKHAIDRITFTRSLPRPLVALMIVLIAGLIVVMIAFGPSFITGKFTEIKNNLINPITDRLGVTVAENRQPFFSEWANSFGPVIQGVPLLFWLFFVGSIVLFHQFTRSLRTQERWLLTLAYIFFLFGIVFSRYAPDAALNGTNTLSVVVYALSFIVLGAAACFVYYRVHKHHGDEQLRQLDFGLLLVLILFFLSIASARGAVRLIMMLVPPAAMLVAYLAVVLVTTARQSKDDLGKSLSWIAVVLVIGATIFAGVRFYEESKALSQSYVPGVYNQQWQRAMAWVRYSTPQNAVFAHWWDYGYWVQSIGNRATIVDGGNAIPYWNHLMGRHVLTGRDKNSALEFLKTHKATHLLIDSTDIGKYGAFSSIGSDKAYDRRSWIPTLGRARVEEAKNHTLIYYQGGFPLDQDLIYQDENGTVTLPEGKAALGAVIIEQGRDGTLTAAPKGIFVFQKNRNAPQEQNTLPLRYAYHNGKYYDFMSGIEAGIVSVPAATQQGSIERDAVILYLSNKTVQSHLARLYLYKDKDPNFVLVHSEDDYIVDQLKRANLLRPDEDFVVYQGLRGPIRIWEINYPEGTQEVTEYLSKEYPEHLRRA